VLAKEEMKMYAIVFSFFKEKESKINILTGCLGANISFFLL
jgi:hypothetical protein